MITFGFRRSWFATGTVVEHNPNSKQALLFREIFTAGGKRMMPVEELMWSVHHVRHLRDLVIGYPSWRQYIKGILLRGRIRRLRPARCTRHN
jgi:hypothetical protein